MRQRCSEDEDDDDEEEEGERPTEKNVAKKAKISNGKTKSTSSKKKPATSPTPVPSSKKSPVPQPKATAAPVPVSAPTPMKMDAVLDINDDDDDLMIIPDDVGLIMGDEEMEEIEKDLFPTITSVTSLHPGNNEQFNDLFGASPLENSGVL